MNKKQIGILGGAFDPPTQGHIKAALFVLENSDLSEIWLTPCAKHMYNKQMESFEHRLEMCEMIAKHDGRIRTFDYESRKNLSGETYQFVKTLLGEDFAKDKYDFSLIIGQDNANTFDKWVNYEDLEKMIRFVVVPRQGEVRDIESDWYLKAPHIYLCGETNIPEISSTTIRHSLKRLRFLDEICNGLDHNEIVQGIVDNTSEEIFRYIQANKLYGEKK